MNQDHELKIAMEIIQLDQKKDELYERLVHLMGSKAEHLLREVQNSEFHD